VIKLDVRKILQGQSRMLTRDPFAVANLSVFSFKCVLFNVRFYCSAFHLFALFIVS